jgi:hypothetical protein
MEFHLHRGGMVGYTFVPFKKLNTLLGRLGHYFLLHHNTDVTELHTA